jgi:hypothetical protein
MKALTTDAANLVRSGEWLSTLHHSKNSAAVREVLVRCAEIMLPYWEARFHQDESMGELVSAMRSFAANPNLETRRSLQLLIPEQRVDRHGGLSPPPGWPVSIESDCPADFAGDAISHAAFAMADSSSQPGSSPYLYSAMDNAIEAIARLFGERDPDEDSPTDHRAAAKEYLRARLLGDTEEQPDAPESPIGAESNGRSLGGDRVIGDVTSPWDCGD